MSERARPRRRVWPWLTVAALLFVVVPLVSLGIAWGGAGLLLTPHHDITTSAGTVQSVEASTATGTGVGRVTLEKSSTTQRVGTYGLQWGDDGSAIIGPEEANSSSTVTRPISAESSPLQAGTPVDLNPNIWSGDPKTALGIDFENVTVEGELGGMPAWQVAGTGDTWAIFVHGIDGSREGGLRPLPALVAAGLPTLLITYRNDVGAPPSPDGLVHLGMTEWRDLDAAADYAVGQGAQKLVLYGDSMGGSIVTRFVHESEFAPRVVGIVLDSPVLDWGGVLQAQTDRFHLGALGPLLQTIVGWRGGIDLADLDELDRTSSFTMPILLYQGLADALVPHEVSQEFAEAVGAEYVPVPDAGHIQSWNAAPEAYETKLTQFLAQF